MKKSQIAGTNVKSKTKSRSLVGPLKVDDKLIKDNRGMAEALNEFFTGVFTREALGPVPTCPRLPSTTNLNNIVFYASDVTKKKLKPDSAPGPDKVTARFLIMNADYFQQINVSRSCPRRLEGGQCHPYL